MFRPPRMSTISLVSARLTSLAVAGFLVACNPDAPTSVESGRYATSAVLAKAPANPTVNSATPDTAAQGSTIDVHVFGTGFTSGATATWQLAGIENPNKIRTNTTTVISSTELVANITISDSADVASWDVQIALVGGKKGIGTELFAVTSKGAPSSLTGTASSGARWVFGALGTSIDGSGNVTLQPAGIFGDGQDPDGVALGDAPALDPFVATPSGAYQAGHCGLALLVYWWSSQSSSGDATLDPTLNTPSSCAPRTYTVKLGSTTANVLGFSNARQVMQLPLNASRRQVMRFRVQQPNCYRITVGTPAADDFNVTSGGVRVTRVAGTVPSTHFLSQVPGYVPGEWLVESVDGKAKCENPKGNGFVAGTSYTGLYFRIHITEIPPTS